MKLERQFKKLDKKLRKIKELQSKKKVSIIYGERLQTVVKKQNSEEDVKEKEIQKLEFLKLLLKMINEGATGFDLAYRLEKNREVKELIYDGILFYNTFLEIGNKKFLDIPDKIKVDYKSFKTVEDTEKYIFMVWLNDMIASLEKEFQPKDDYAKYIEAKKAEERKKAEKKVRELLTHCRNCGARIQSKEQEFCEKCGVNLIESVFK